MPPRVEVTPAREGWPPRPAGRTDVRSVPWTEIAGDVTDGLARDLREAIERDPGVLAALGPRWAFVTVDRVPADKLARPNAGAPAAYRAWYFSHTANAAVAVELRDLRVTNVRTVPDYSPPEGTAEIDSAVALARTDPRLAGRVAGLTGRAIVTYALEGAPGRGHRLLHVTFWRGDEDAPPFAAIVDLTERTVLRSFAREGR